MCFNGQYAIHKYSLITVSYSFPNRYISIDIFTAYILDLYPFPFDVTIYTDFFLYRDIDDRLCCLLLRSIMKSHRGDHNFHSVSLTKSMLIHTFLIRTIHYCACIAHRQNQAQTQNRCQRSSFFIVKYEKTFLVR